MRKKLLYSFLLISILLGSFALFPKTHTNSCAFCNPSVISSQLLYEGTFTYALYTHRPIVPGHCLILPKRHVERFENLSDEECLELTQVIKKIHQAVSHAYQTSGYLLVEKNGPEAFQSVPHVHFHYIPRKKEDSSSLLLLFKTLFSAIKNPISPTEMLENREKIQKEL